MTAKRTVRDAQVLAAHRFYLEKVIPILQDATKDLDLRVCEGIMTCIVVHQAKSC